MNRKTSRGIAPVSLACETFSLSRQAFYAAQHRMPLIKAHDDPARVGPDKGKDTSKGSSTQRGPKNVIPAEILRPAIHEVVKNHSAWGVRKVWATLRRQGLRAGQKRIWALMKADGLTMEPSAVRESPGRYGHVTVPESNRRWATDMTSAWTAKDGVVAVVPVIDCGDRVTFRCSVTKSQESGAVLAPIEQALIEEFGSVENLPADFELRTDHGPQYTGQDCFEMCEDWGIDHTFAPVGRPTGNAVAERFILTLKTELIWTQDWSSLEELRTAIDDWLEVYNGSRPHQAMNYMMPYEKRALNLGLQHDAAA
jgi:putative transposase